MSTPFSSETISELIESDFRMVFWYDDLGILEQLDCAPLIYFKEQLQNDQDGFYSLKVNPVLIEKWLTSCRQQLELNRDSLPTMYELWEVKERYKQSGDGFFRHNGEIYQVSAWRSRFACHGPLDKNRYETTLARLSYQMPNTNNLPTDFTLIPYDGPLKRTLPSGTGYQLEVKVFELLFKNTPLVLEHKNFADFFASELEKIAQVIETCKKIKELLICSF